MQVNLRSPAKRWAAAATVVAVTAGYCGIAASRFLADRFEQTTAQTLLQRAARLDPSNAEYQHNVGIRELAFQSPARAVPWLQSAADLNPNAARYWIDLAAAEQLLGNATSENKALDRALRVDPHTPAIAWQAANLFLAEGLTERAMQQFRTVLQSDPQMTAPALRTAWEIHPDVDFLLQEVVPPAANIPFLQFLISKKQTVAAETVWNRIYSLQQEVQRTDLLAYERYLLGQKEVSQASRVWQQGAVLSDLAAYQPSPENLIVNGDFSLDILNGGFDWVHEPVAGVSVALDSSETRVGGRSVRIVLDGAEISDAGISQFVSVEPNTRYEFTAFYKAQDMDGAGSMQLAIHDAYRAIPLFMSEDLSNADFWKSTGGTFVTPADTDLVIVHVVRVPAGRPIRGKLWIDGLRLVQSETEVK